MNERSSNGISDTPLCTAPIHEGLTVRGCGNSLPCSTHPVVGLLGLLVRVAAELKSAAATFEDIEEDCMGLDDKARGACAPLLDGFAVISRQRIDAIFCLLGELDRLPRPPISTEKQSDPKP